MIPHFYKRLQLNWKSLLGSEVLRQETYLPGDRRSDASIMIHKRETVLDK